MEERKHPDCAHQFSEGFYKLLEISEAPAADFKQISTTPRGQVFQRQSDPECKLVRSLFDVNFPAETIFRAIWDAELRGRWDKNNLEFRVLEENGDNQIVYVVIKTPIITSNRDFVQRRCFIRDYPEPGTICIYATSIEYPSMPPQNGLVRGETLFIGSVIRPTGSNSSSVVNIVHSDMKGNLPKASVNKSLAKNAGNWLEAIENGCRLIS